MLEKQDVYNTKEHAIVHTRQWGARTRTIRKRTRVSGSALAKESNERLPTMEWTPVNVKPRE
jgi:hypothetical protein